MKVGKDRVGLDEFFGVMVVEALEDVRAHPGARAARDGVAQDETFQGVAVGRFPVDDVHDLLTQKSSLGIPRRPIVPGAPALLAEKHVFHVEQLSIG